MATDSGCWLQDACGGVEASGCCGCGWRADASTSLCSSSCLPERVPTKADKQCTARHLQRAVGHAAAAALLPAATQVHISTSTPPAPGVAEEEACAWFRCCVLSLGVLLHSPDGCCCCSSSRPSAHCISSAGRPCCVAAALRGLLLALLAFRRRHQHSIGSHCSSWRDTASCCCTCCCCCFATTTGCVLLPLLPHDCCAEAAAATTTGCC